MLTIYGIRNCDTMKKACAWLDQVGIAYHFHDYKKEGAPESALKRWIDELGWENVINRRGTTWRKLPEADRERMDTALALEAAKQSPSLIRRPVLERGTMLLLGFDVVQWQAALR